MSGRAWGWSLLLSTLLWAFLAACYHAAHHRDGALYHALLAVLSVAAVLLGGAFGGAFALAAVERRRR